MRNRLLALVVPALLVPACAASQEQTERFIPIGESPGISGVYSTVGTIVGIDTDGRTVTLRDGTDSLTVRITDETDVWIDRSAAQRPNLVGGMTDLVPGRTVEVTCVNPEAREVARWIKVAED